MSAWEHAVKLNKATCSDGFGHLKCRWCRSRRLFGPKPDEPTKSWHRCHLQIPLSFCLERPRWRENEPARHHSVESRRHTFPWNGQTLCRDFEVWDVLYLYHIVPQNWIPPWCDGLFLNVWYYSDVPWHTLVGPILSGARWTLGHWCAAINTDIAHRVLFQRTWMLAKALVLGENVAGKKHTWNSGGQWFI